MKILRHRPGSKTLIGLLALCVLILGATRIFLQGDPVSSRIRKLHSGDVEQRRDAAIELLALDTEAKAAVPELIVALRSDPDMQVRYSAALALGEILQTEPDRAATAPAIAALVDALGDSDVRVRTQTAAALSSINAGAPEVVLALDQLMKSRDEQLRKRAAIVLDQVAASIPSEAPKVTIMLVAALKDQSPIVRAAAVVGLNRRIQNPQKMLPIFLEMMKDGDPGVRIAIVRTYRREVPAIRPAPPVLLAALKDSESSVRVIAAQAFKDSSAKAELGVPALISALSDSEAEVRAASASALGLYGLRAEAALEPLTKATQDTSENVRVEATAAQKRISGAVSEAPAEVAALLADLSAPQGRRRMRAADALATFGPDAAPAVLALTKALKDRNADVRGSAAHALGRIGAAARDALPAIKGVESNDADDGVRRESAKARQAIESAITTADAKP
jgi:HEAT repeat protein